MHLVVGSGVLVLVGTLMAWRSNRNWLSPPLITLGVLLLFYGGAIVYFCTTGHALTPFYVAVGVLFYGCGALLGARLKDFKPVSELESFSSAPFVSMFPVRRVFVVTLWTVGLLSIIDGALYFCRAGVPLLTEWSSLARTEAISGGGLYLRSLSTFLPMSVLVAFLYRKYHKTRSSTLLISVLLTASGVFLILYGSRGAAINYVVPLLFVLGVLHKRKASGKAIMLIAVFLLAGLTLQSSYSGYRDLPAADTVGVFAGRLTTQQVEALDYFVYDVIPLRGFYLGEVHGNGLRGILGLFRIIPYEPPFGEILFRMKAGGQVSAGFTLVTTSLGDLYADFGLIGICVGMFVYGVIAQVLYIRLLRSRKDYFWLAVLCYFQFVVLCAHIGGEVFGVLADKGASLAALVLLMIFLYSVLCLPTGAVTIASPRRLKRPGFSDGTDRDANSGQRAGI